MAGFNLVDDIVYNRKISSSGEDVVAINADFKNVKVSDFTITSIDATGCCFNHCDLNGVYTAKGIIRGCFFADVYFNDIILEHILFEGCKFERCSFGNMRFGRNEFANCRFSHCNLPTNNFSFFYTMLKRGAGNVFSQCTGYPSPSEFLAQNFERNEANTGYIVYKTFGHLYASPKEWMITPGSIITENCDLNRLEACSYGINVATLEWIRSNVDAAHGGIHRDSESPFSIWRCEILDEWLADVCVPIGSDGKIRCGKLRLIETI